MKSDNLLKLADKFQKLAFTHYTGNEFNYFTSKSLQDSGGSYNTWTQTDFKLNHAIVAIARTLLQNMQNDKDAFMKADPEVFNWLTKYLNAKIKENLNKEDPIDQHSKDMFKGFMFIIKSPFEKIKGDTTKATLIPDIGKYYDYLSDAENSILKKMNTLELSDIKQISGNRREALPDDCYKIKIGLDEAGITDTYEMLNIFSGGKHILINAIFNRINWLGSSGAAYNAGSRINSLMVNLMKEQPATITKVSEVNKEEYEELDNAFNEATGKYVSFADLAKQALNIINSYLTNNNIYVQPLKK